MTLSLADYERQAREATMAFWGNREKARQKQIEAGNVDAGERGGVTAGKNMDGFVALIIDLVKENGLGHADIHQTRAVVTLPGYFRPTKLWDLLVINEGRLIAAGRSGDQARCDAAVVALYGFQGADWKSMTMREAA